MNCAWLWFMEALLTSCSGLALQLKRLTEINMFIWNGFSREKKKKRKKCHICGIIKKGESRGEKWLWNDSSLKVQWGTAFHRRNTYLKGWRYSRKANKYSFLDSCRLTALSPGCILRGNLTSAEVGLGTPLQVMHHAMVQQVVCLLRTEAASCFVFRFEGVYSVL